MRKNYKKFLLKIGGSLVLTATLLFNSNNVFGQNTVAFVHGSDDGNNSGTGISGWVFNSDGTVNTTEVTFATGGTNVFGEDGSNQTFFADVNGDGFADIVNVNETGTIGTISVYLNKLDNTFETTAITTTGFDDPNNGIYGFTGIGSFEQGWVADVDGDGNNDYAVSGSDNKIHVYLGAGNGSFSTTKVTTTLTGEAGNNTSGISATQYFDLVDVNSDKKADLVAGVDNNGGTIQVWLSTSGGSFDTTVINTNITDTGTTNTAGRGLNEYSQFIDVDGNGIIDYVHAESLNTPDEQIHVFLGNNNGTFANTAVITNFTTFPFGNAAYFVSYEDDEQSFFYDVNGDGKADYINGIEGNGISVYLGTGTGSFVTTPTDVTLANFDSGLDSNETTYVIKGMLLSPSELVLAQIAKEADDPDSVNSAVTTAQLGQIDPAVTGIVAANEAAYQDYIDANPTKFSSPLATQAEVQAMIDTVNLLVSIGEDEDDAAASSDNLTAAQYNSIEDVSGAVAANEAAYQAYIDANEGNFSSPATAAEVQTMIDTVNALAEVLEDSDSTGGNNNGNGTAVTATQLAAIDGVTGVDPANEAAYQAAIAAETGFSNPPTVAEVQAIIDEVNTNAALTEVLEDSASTGGNNNGNGTAVTAAQLASIDGITGVDPANEAAYQAAIAAEDGFDNPPTVAQVQAIINSVNLLVSIGEDANGGGANNLTAAQYNSIEGVSGALAANEAAYQFYIDNLGSFSQPATAQEVQDMIDAVNTQVALTEVLEDSASAGGNNNGNGTAVTADQLASIDGITGVNPANEAAYQAAIAAEGGFSNPPTVAQVQAIIDTVNSNASNAALAEVLEDSASTGGNNNGNGTAVTAAQLSSIDGITGVDPANEAAYQAAINAETGFNNPPTVAQVQEIIDRVNASQEALAEVLEDSVSPGGANNANGTAVTLAQLQAIDGIMNVVPANLARYQSAIAAEAGFSNPPTLAQVQAIINAENANALADEDFELSKKFSVYPNPTADILYLQKEVKNVKVFDILGKKLIDVDNTKEINLTNYRTGVYYVMIKTEVSSFTKKVIKK